MLSGYEKLTANTGLNTLITANTGLDGGGTTYSVLTAASNGTYIKTITIKSLVALCTGNMVRLFITNNDGDDPQTKLLEEVLIHPAGGGTASVFSAYELIIPLNFTLKSGYSILATTNITSKIAVMVDGLDISYP